MELIATTWQSALDWLLAPVPVAAGFTTSWAEILGFVTGAACVGLAARGSIWNWPIGLANSVFWLVLFAGSGLYADAFLQVVYLIMGAYGWWHWLHGGPRATERPIGHVGRVELGFTALATITGVVLWTYFLGNYTNSRVPFADAATTVISLAANWLLARKFIENWPVWIFGANIPYVALYVYKGLALTASLQLVYIALSIAGWVAWHRMLTSRRALQEATTIVVSQEGAV